MTEKVGSVTLIQSADSSSSAKKTPKSLRSQRATAYGQIKEPLQSQKLQQRQPHQAADFGASWVMD